MALDTSLTPVTNTVKTQLGGINKKLNNTVSYVRRQTKLLEDKVNAYYNKSTKNKDKVVSDINKIKQRISDKVTTATKEAESVVKDVTAAVADAQAKANEMAMLLGPLATPPSTDPGSIVSWIKNLIALLSKFGVQAKAEQADTALATTEVMKDSQEITSSVNDLKSLMNKVNSITNKFN